MLTTQQKATLKAFIQADPTLGPEAVAQNYYLMATQLNAQASPAFTVWKSSVTVAAVGNAMLGSDVANLTTANTGRPQTYSLFAGGFFTPTNLDMQAGFSWNYPTYVSERSIRANLLNQ